MLFTALTIYESYNFKLSLFASGVGGRRQIRGNKQKIATVCVPELFFSSNDGENTQVRMTTTPMVMLMMIDVVAVVVIVVIITQSFPGQSLTINRPS